jgi:zinc protease
MINDFYMINNIAALLFLLLITFQLSWAQETDKTQESFREKRPPAGALPSVQIGAFEQFVLENELQVVVVENHKLPQVAFRLFVDVPLVKEGPKAGAAALCGALLSKGTSKQTAAEIDEAIHFIGAEFSTLQDGIWASCPSRHMLSLLDIMQDVLLNPAFSDAEFEKVRQEQYSTLVLEQSSSNFMAKHAGTALCYDDHPYGEVVSRESLQKISVEDCKSYYTTYFKPNISYLAIVGDIDVDTAKKMAAQYFGAWEKGEVPKRFFNKPKLPSPAELNFIPKEDASQAVINITYPVNLKPGTKEAIAASILNTALGSGTLDSRLNKKLRGEKGYSYGLRSTLKPDKYVGFFSAGGNLRDAVTDSTILYCLEAMKRLREEEMPEEELKRVKRYITGQFARSIEQPLTLAEFAVNTARYKLPANFYPSYLKKLEEVSAQDVKAAAQKYLLPDQAHIVVVAPGAVLAKLESMPLALAVNSIDLNGQKKLTIQDTIPSVITAQMIIEQYLEVVGGQQKLDTISDQYLKMTAKVENRSLEVETFKKIPDKFLRRAKLNDNIISELKCSAQTGAMTTMGQQQELKAAELEQLQMQRALFPELSALRDAYVLELAGMEDIEGKMAYHIVITTPWEQIFHYYYDRQTNLKVKAVYQRKNLQGQDVKVTNTYSDYQLVDGVRMPHKVITTGMAPHPVTFKVESILHNGGMEDSLFTKE